MNDAQKWMKQAVLCAQTAENENEVPVGCVAVLNEQIIGYGWNQNITQCDPTAHAEIMAIRKAGQYQKNHRLNGVDLYVTVEPCLMCLGAMIHARIKKIYFGAFEPKAGALVSNSYLYQTMYFVNHRIEYESGILETQCRHLLQNFFKSRRG